MFRIEKDGLSFYVPASLPEDRVTAFVSTRTGGSSAPPFDSLNLGLRVGDEESAVLRNRHRVFAAAETDLASSVWCRQVHSDGVHIATGQDAGRGSMTEQDIVLDIDALATNTPGITLCVTLADCVPVFLFDPVNDAVGLSHAGWGGTVSHVTRRLVESMVEGFGSEPSDIQACIGPSISPATYEVGEDVAQKAREAFPRRHEALLVPRSSPGKYLFDLWQSNVFDLVDAGLRRESVEVANISTVDHLDQFYSHRAERRTGRFIAAVQIPRSGSPLQETSR